MFPNRSAKMIDGTEKPKIAIQRQRYNSPLVGLSKTEHNDYRNQTRSDAFEACHQQRKVLLQEELRAKKEKQH